MEALLKMVGNSWQTYSGEDKPSAVCQKSFQGGSWFRQVGHVSQKPTQQSRPGTQHLRLPIPSQSIQTDKTPSMGSVISIAITASGESASHWAGGVCNQAHLEASTKVSTDLLWPFQEQHEIRIAPGCRASTTASDVATAGTDRAFASQCKFVGTPAVARAVASKLPPSLPSERLPTGGTADCEGATSGVFRFPTQLLFAFKDRRWGGGMKTALQLHVRMVSKPSKHRQVLSHHTYGMKL
jgi:hypothetical protein